MEITLLNFNKKHLPVLESLAKSLGFEIGKSKEVEERSEKGFDAKLFSGKIKLDKDPLDIQKEMRDEWE